jgi:ATP-dependent helicase HrpB
VLEAQERKFSNRSQVYIQSAVAIDESWLFDLGVTERHDLNWNPQTQKLESTYKMMYDQLVLEQSPEPPPLTEDTVRIILKNLEVHQIIDIEKWNNLNNRLLLLKNHGTDVELEFDKLLLQALQASAVKDIGLKSLTSLDLFSIINEQLPAKVQTQLRELVPTHVKLSQGRSVAINYEVGKAPWIESRLQDFFGMSKGPTIMNGKVPLTLHLLAPNKRAVQVTSDLSGFWQRDYPKLKIELGRRYPRHKWPDNPV